MYPEVGSGALPLHGFDLAFGALHAEAPLVGLRVVSDTFTRKLASPLETCLGRGLRIQLGAFPISASKVSRSWPVSSQSTTSEPAAVATNGHAVQPPSVPVLRVGCRHAPAERLRHHAHFLRVDDAIQVAVAVDGDDLPRARRDGGTAEQVGHSQADRGHDVAVPAAGEAAHHHLTVLQRDHEARVAIVVNRTSAARGIGGPHTYAASLLTQRIEHAGRRIVPIGLLASVETYDHATSRYVVAHESR